MEESAAPDDPFVDVEGQTIAELHRRAEEDVSSHQRVLEALAKLLGRPAFVYFVLAGVSAWALANTGVGQRLGIARFDPPPFYLLQGVMTCCALLTTIVVLVNHSRQSVISKRRALLSLHVNLLVEHKVAKLISLVEELRRDMPTVHDRRDDEAAAMSSRLDPHAVMDRLEQATSDTTAATRKPPESERS